MEISTSSKDWWGPRIWKILHSLAELSDRSGCMFMWKSILRLTADILPCHACSIHFRQRVPMFHTSSTLSGNDVRNRIREFLWASHQDVNGQHTKPGIQLEELANIYGIHEGYDRNNISQSILSIVDEVVLRFTSDNVMDRFHTNIPIQWKREIISLVHYLTLPDVPLMPPVRSIRRGRARPGR